MTTKKVFRKGAIGAMMDEYERAAKEIQGIVQSIGDDTYERIMDESTQDENCRSIQTIMSHVVASGYSYADYFRKHFGMQSGRPGEKLLSRQEAIEGISAVLKYTIETLENQWEMSEEQIVATKMPVRWGPVYDAEQLFEHAIVHVLRHRRQLDKFLK